MITDEARKYGAGVSHEYVDCDFGISPNCTPVTVAGRDWVGYGRRFICSACVVAAVDELVKGGHLAYTHERGHPYCEANLALEEVPDEIQANASRTGGGSL